LCFLNIDLINPDDFIDNYDLKLHEILFSQYNKDFIYIMLCDIINEYGNDLYYLDDDIITNMIENIEYIKKYIKYLKSKYRYNLYNSVNEIIKKLANESELFIIHYDSIQPK
jgi:2-phospho-L-lactate guanylyltransferase (CobY/MobA/RfbA family)